MQTLEFKAYRRQSLMDSMVDWTGRFSREAVDITVLSKPGIDIEAHFPDGKVLVAECKGEPTPSGSLALTSPLFIPRSDS